MELNSKIKLAQLRGITQDKSINLEVQSNEGLERGYTRLPNSLLMQMARGDFNRNEIKILLIIARFTISYQTEMAPLSRRVLERLTQLGGSTVLDTISSLQTKGAIRKEQGDQFSPNKLGLILKSDWKGIPIQPLSLVKEQPLVIPLPNPTPRVEAAPDAPTEAALAEGEKQALPRGQSQPHPWIENAPQGRGQISPPFKDNINIIKNNSLSEAPENLQKYFQDLRPLKKRESELRAFGELKKTYSQNEIADCLERLLTRGIASNKGGESQSCHSPMAYLSKAMDGVLRQVKKSQKAERPSEGSKENIASVSLTRTTGIRAEELLQDRMEWMAKERAFLEAYPELSQQEDAIAAHCQNSIFKPQFRSGRIYAITQWWRASSQAQQRTA